jgi:molybdenum cofactor guanylyltransferase
MALANGERRIASGEPSTNGGITAFVLAGGRSSRMGRDKALLSLDGRNLLQRALQTAASVADGAYIVGSRQLYAKFGETVEDVYSGCGPLGGIHAALASTETDLNLIISVDIPRMTTEFLRWLIAHAKSRTELIVVPEAAGGLQPLCAIYRKAVAATGEQALQQGDYKVGHLFSRVPTCIVAESTITAAGFSPELFLNINTPEEYANC